MKKTITTLSLGLIVIAGTSAFIKNSTGIANYTGAPGEVSCNNCHGGATSASSGITITATPSFTNDEYVPGTIYTISINAIAAGKTHYGFDCEILDGSNASTGTMQAPGAGVKFINGAGKRNAVHTQPKTATGAANFTFQWKAPDGGAGDATIYVAANAVDGTGSTNNDFPIPPVSKGLAEAVPTVTTGIVSRSKTVSQISVYPNPSNGLSTVSYFLNEAQLMHIELIDISGKLVKHLLHEEQNAGLHSQLLDLQNIPAGVYFVKTSANNQKVSQKLITVQ